MSSVDPIRRLARLRRTARPDGDSEEVRATTDAGLPVPVEPARTVPPPRVETPPAEAAFGAQLLGQVGEKRGLRAGPSLIDRASASYNRAEYSGAKDRRRRKGGITSTEI